MAKLIKDINNLATYNSQLTKKQATTKNGHLTPQDVTCGSNKKV